MKCRFLEKSDQSTKQKNDMDWDLHVMYGVNMCIGIHLVLQMILHLHVYIFLLTPCTYTHLYFMMHMYYYVYTHSWLYFLYFMICTYTCHMIFVWYKAVYQRVYYIKANLVIIKNVACLAGCCSCPCSDAMALRRCRDAHDVGAPESFKSFSGIGDSTNRLYWWGVFCLYL